MNLDRMAAGMLGLVLFSTAAFSIPKEDPGPWSFSSEKTGEWIKAPNLAESAEITCHLYGEGAFRVHLKQGEKDIRRTIETPVRDWVSFTRRLQAGPLEVMIEAIAASNGPLPVMGGFVAVSNPDYAPNLADFQQAIYMRARNLSAQDTGIFVDGGRGDLTAPLFKLGYLVSGGYAATGKLKPGESTGLINLSRQIRERSRLTFQPKNATNGVDIEVSFFRDAAGQNPIRAFSVKGKPAINETIIFYPDKKSGTIKIIDIAELFTANLKALEGVDLRRPTPKKIWTMVNHIMDLGEDIAAYGKEFELAVRIGMNGAYRDLGRLENRRQELPLNYRMDGIPITYYAQPRRFSQALADERIPKWLAATKPGIPCLLNMGDEPRFLEMPKSPELDRAFKSWMEGKGLKPRDAGVTSWEDARVIPPDPSKKRLATLAREFQTDEQVRFWSGYAEAARKFNPDLLPFVNFAVAEYNTGITLDLWEVYRRPGMSVVWGEDWLEGMPPMSGITAWYAELMRSQAKYRNLRTGSYPIIGHGGGYAVPSMSLFKYYERLMRGNSIFNFYPYSPRGNEASWLDEPRNSALFARLNRDVAEVEDIVTGGRVLPARVAIMYPVSCLLWDRSAYLDAVALYFAHLHAGIPMDIITEQDAVDGYAAGYQALWLVGANIRLDALNAVGAYLNKGGTVISSSPAFRDPYDEPIADAAGILGAGAIEQLANENPGGFYNHAGERPLDTVKWDGKEIKVYFQKARIAPGPNAEVVATFADGTPAVVKGRKGRGTVYLYGFAPGLSYMTADLGNRSSMPTGLCGKRNERALCILPVGCASETVRMSSAMIGGRIIAGPEAALVGLVDYGAGKLGRDKPNPECAAVDFEKMEPYPVTIEIACNRKPDDIRGVRCGKAPWNYAGGKATVQLPLRGAELLILKGKELFGKGGAR